MGELETTGQCKCMQCSQCKDRECKCAKCHCSKVWCGPEPTDTLQEYINEMLAEKEIKKLNAEIQKLEGKLRERKPKANDSVIHLDSSALKKCLKCLAMKRQYPELLDNVDNCICNKDNDNAEKNKNCLWYPELFGNVDKCISNKDNDKAEKNINCLCQPQNMSILR